MDDPNRTFSTMRLRLQRMALLILGSEAHAQDVVDAVEARFKLQRGVLDAPVEAAAWLVSATSHLAFQRRRCARAWPELAECPPPATPSRIAALTENILGETHAALEQLAPEARLAFLLHDVFDADLAELAMTLGRRKADCQALIECARRALHQYLNRRTS
jgi:RNA polymerase sigma-70 factor (ECF subfamily)